MTEEQTTEETSTEEAQTETTSTISSETGDTATETPTTEESEQTEETVDTKTETETETETETITEGDEESTERVIPGVEDYTLPEGVPTNVAQFAHDNDFTQEQLNATLGLFGSYVQGNEKAQKAVIRREGNELVDSWGKQKKGNLSLVRRALAQNDPDGDLTAVLDKTGFGNHPQVLSFFLRVGNSMQEGGFLKSANNTPSKGGTSAALAMFGGSHPSSN